MTSTSDRESVHVVVRCRPFLPHETSTSTSTSLMIQENSIHIQALNKNKTFQYDRVFDQAASQRQVYEEVSAEDVVLCCAMLCYAILCYAMLVSCRVVLCCVISCHSPVMLCHVISCQVARILHTIFDMLQIFSYVAFAFVL